MYNVDLFITVFIDVYLSIYISGCITSINTSSDHRSIYKVCKTSNYYTYIYITCIWIQKNIRLHDIHVSSCIHVPVFITVTCIIYRWVLWWVQYTWTIHL